MYTVTLLVTLQVGTDCACAYHVVYSQLTEGYADLEKAAATMARLLAVCCSSLMAAPVTAPLKIVKTSS